MGGTAYVLLRTQYCMGRTRCVGLEHPQTMITILPLFYLTGKRIPCLPIPHHTTLMKWEWPGYEALLWTDSN